MPSSSSAPGRLSLRAPCDPAQSRRGKHRKHPGQDLHLPIAEEQQPGQHTARQTAHAAHAGRHDAQAEHTADEAEDHTDDAAALFGLFLVLGCGCAGLAGGTCRRLYAICGDMALLIGFYGNRLLNHRIKQSVQQKPSHRIA